MQTHQNSSVGTHRSALRLINTKGMDHDEWLEVRKTGIGASDAAAAVGLSPYKSQLALWLEKTGRDSQMTKPDPEDMSHPVYWGTILEPIVAKAYCEHSGNKVRRVNAVLQHPEHPWMLANIDREVTGNPEVSILECKTAGEYGAKHWKEGVPEYVQLQVQHQLAVTGKFAADVAVLICGQRLEVFRIERDEALILRLIDLERHFWQYVEEDVAPPADGSDSAEQALRALYPGIIGGRVDLSDNRNLSSKFADLVAIREDIKHREEVANELRNALIQAMGNAEIAQFETGSVSYKRSRDTSTLDIKRIREERPDIALEYSLVRPGSRRFLVSGHAH